MRNVFKDVVKKWHESTKQCKPESAGRIKGGLVVIVVVAIGCGAAVLPSMVNSHRDVNFSELSSTEAPRPAKAVSKTITATTDQTIVHTKPFTDETTDKAKYTTVAEIIAGYLAGESAAKALCTPWSCDKEDDGWIIIENKGSYYPGAVYDGDWKDVSAVLQSYRDGSQPWVERIGYNETVIWSKNYRHRFAINENWLTLDGVRVLPTVEDTYDLNPDTLIKRYQAGKWDGKKIYSEDHFTSATISSVRGVIDYKYSRQPAEDYDYRHGKSYNLIHTELVYRPEETHGPAYKDWDVVINEDIEENYLGIEVGSAHSKQYVDLPNGRIDEEIVDSRVCEDGTLIALKNEVRLYDKGELIESWSGFTLSDDGFIMAGDQKEKLLYTNNEVFRLQEGGALEKLMSGVFYIYDSYEGFMAFASLCDGVVTYGTRGYDEPFRIAEIERNVTEAFVEMRHIFMKKADGTVRVWNTYGDEHKEYVTYLIDRRRARSWLSKPAESFLSENSEKRFKTFMKDIIKAEKAREVTQGQNCNRDL